MRRACFIAGMQSVSFVARAIRSPEWFADIRSYDSGEQKGIDMRIGIDLANLPVNRQDLAILSTNSGSFGGLLECITQILVATK